jgi:RNA polymerase sigma-70 factor (ECF subfamily)
MLKGFQLGERAEDVVQEAFFEAYCCLGNLRDPLAFKSWLRRIIIKRCDRVIREQRGELLPLESTELPSSEPEPAQVVALQELRAELTVAFASLPDKVSEVATRFYLNGESQKEDQCDVGSSGENR